MKTDPTNKIITLSEKMIETLEDSQKAVETYCNKTMEDYTDYNLPDLIQLRHNLKQIITTLEINIKLYELDIKTLTIQLKNTQEYMELKTQKAREEQAILETNELKTLLLQNKKNRNRLNDTHELIITILRLEFILLTENIEETEAEEE